VNFQALNLEFFATICPHFNLQGGSVSTTLFDLGISFNFTVVKLPQCLAIDTGTVLQVPGFGILIYGTSIVQGVFTLRLMENLVGNDSFYFEVSGIDQNGNTYSVSISQTISDEDLTINNTAKSNELQEELNRGQNVIVKNGQVEVE
jgi:hypothetical protein